MLVRRIHSTIPAFVLTAGMASAAMAQSIQVVTPAPAPVQSQVIIAPSAPPAPRVETIPPQPTDGTRVMYWQPGHWMWDGASWSWSQGQYVQQPTTQAVWEPGHWAQQPSGGYVWVDGHWQS